MEFHDDAGRLVVVEPPSRIVSLVPSLTELVCRLGLAHRLVGVTRYCTEPAAIVAHLPRVGGTKNPDVARIAALRPDLVLVNSEENRLEDFQALVDAQLAVWVSYPRTVREAARSIARMGAVLGADDRAAAVASQIEAALADPPRRRVRVFCPIWRNPWMAFNADTFAGDLLSCAGGDNVCAGRVERYPVVDLDEIRRADPQVILLPDEPYRFADRHRAALEPLSDSSAGRDGRIYLIDGKALSWYGHRTGPALRTFRRLLGV
jgi:ABC-type Fe3+-hydroxamate transport system substrate-binding protein